ncbi:MAG TPA: phosphatase PAP2 family protein [Gemmatimonadales bacterium]|nr:phosphatase PAP2 family protein [Gemmatimonadales bacterium]
MNSSPPLITRRFLAAAVVAVLLAHLLDRWTYHHLMHPAFQNTDLGRLLRIQGFLPTWVAVAAALVLTDWPRRALDGGWSAWRRGVLLVGSAAAGGAAAELLKIVVRRERPGAAAGAYLFRAWSDRPLSTAGFGMASSHVGVAFGALAMLGYFYPRTRPVCYLLAAGCAFSRLAAGAHFLSDVTVAGILGLLVAGWLWRKFPPPVIA